jgi:hypothetical protein
MEETLMSNTASTTTQRAGGYDTDGYPTSRRVSTETKASVKTTELIAYVVTVVGVILAAMMADEASDFGVQEASFYVSLLTIGYMISRGLAKSGSRDYYDDGNKHTTR